MAQRGRPKNLSTGGKSLNLDMGALNPKQLLFIESKVRYTAYGGARGGGKTHILIRKAVSGALQYAGMKILILRRTYPELEGTIIQPMITLVNSATINGRPAGDQIATYNGTMRTMTFVNGSVVKFGHLQSANAIHEYQGQQYDWIFMDEATHFSEWEFRTLGATLRGVNKIPKQFFLTCNPGGVGHQWVKRLFIAKEYDAKKHENAKDYLFIPATVEDNKALMDSSPEYLQMLDSLPDDIRAAHRYGDWDAMAGQYFPEFKREIHVVKPFPIPREWPKYRVFDFGLDMLACYWVAVDFDGRFWFYREYCESRLIVSQAAEMMRSLTPAEEWIQCTVAPPDMWSTQKDTGRTMAEVFMSNGIGLVKASNLRVPGWMLMKEALKVREDGKPGLLIFEDCMELIKNIPALQHSSKNQSDCADKPHDITHSPDACRYFCAFRALGAKDFVIPEVFPDEDEAPEDYDEAMCGGEADQSYLQFG